MTVIAHTWTILHHTDWGHAHDSLLPENAPVPEGDEQFRVIEVVPADQLEGAVDALRAVVSYAAPPHPEPCGTDACLLCLIHGTAQFHAGGR